MFECIKNCGECCGLVPFQEDTILNNIDKIQVKPTETVNIDAEKQYDGSIQKDIMYPMTDDGLCIFLRRKDMKCMIYNDRPDVCKKYGTIQELPCPYINYNGNKRSPAKVKRIQRQINHDVDFKLKQITKHQKVIHEAPRFSK